MDGMGDMEDEEGFPGGAGEMDGENDGEDGQEIGEDELNEVYANLLNEDQFLQMTEEEQQEYIRSMQEF